MFIHSLRLLFSECWYKGQTQRARIKSYPFFESSFSIDDDEILMMIEIDSSHSSILRPCVGSVEIEILTAEKHQKRCYYGRKKITVHGVINNSFIRKIT